MTALTKEAGARPQAAVAFLAAVPAIIMWGATPAATAITVDEIDPLGAGVLRTVLAAAIVVPVALMLRLPLPRGRGQWGLLLMSGFGGFAGFTLLFSYGLSLTSTAHAALILAGLPIVAGLGNALFDRRMPRVIWWIGVSIAFGGEVLMIGSRDPGGQASLSGDMLCIAAMVCSGMGYVAGSRLTMKIGTWATTFWGIGLAALMQLPLLPWIIGGTEWAAVSAAGWSGLGFLVIFSSVVGYCLWYWAMATGGVVRIAPIQFAQPVVSLILAVALFSEAITVPIAVATVAILAGIALARRG